MNGDITVAQDATFQVLDGAGPMNLTINGDIYNYYNFTLSTRGTVDMHGSIYNFHNVEFSTDGQPNNLTFNFHGREIVNAGDNFELYQYSTLILHENPKIVTYGDFTIYLNAKLHWCSKTDKQINIMVDGRSASFVNDEGEFTTNVPLTGTSGYKKNGYTQKKCATVNVNPPLVLDATPCSP